MLHVSFSFAVINDYNYVPCRYKGFGCKLYKGVVHYVT